MKSNTLSSHDLIGPPINMCTKMNHLTATVDIIIGGDLYSLVKKNNDYGFKELTGFSLVFKDHSPEYGIGGR